MQPGIMELSETKRVPLVFQRVSFMPDLFLKSSSVASCRLSAGLGMSYPSLAVVVPCVSRSMAWCWDGGWALDPKDMAWHQRAWRMA